MPRAERRSTEKIKLLCVLSVLAGYKDRRVGKDRKIKSRKGKKGWKTSEMKRDRQIQGRVCAVLIRRQGVQGLWITTVVFLCKVGILCSTFYPKIFKKHTCTHTHTWMHTHRDNPEALRHLLKNKRRQKSTRTKHCFKFQKREWNAIFMTWTHIVCIKFVCVFLCVCLRVWVC